MAVKQNGMKRTKLLDVHSAKQQFHLLEVFFENILIRVDTADIWLYFGIGGLTMAELRPCPKCGRRPLLGYACGEYFIVGQVGGCGVCDMFGEMHASREQEVEAWNRRVKNDTN